jgi:molybdopterin-containing oxidoreductase family membrane subunit
VFGWNVILYPGMYAIVGVYLWTLMERRMNPYSKAAGLTTFIWRILLTTGTGSIFAFLVARQAYGNAILPAMFIIMSFAWGLATFMIVQKTMFGWNAMTLHPAIRSRMKNLLGTFVAAVFYFVATYHLTNIYFARQTAFEEFILLSGGIFPLLFWVGYVLVGTIIPLLLIYVPDLNRFRGSVFLASTLVIIGAFCLLYVFIIGGQAYPLDIFPGYDVKSSFMDGAIDSYSPTLPETLLAFGGMGIAYTITIIGVRALRFLPQDDIAELEAAGSIVD